MASVAGAAFVAGREGLSMDWTNTAQLLQTLLVGLGVLFFVMGYRAGDKV